MLRSTLGVLGAAVVGMSRAQHTWVVGRLIAVILVLPVLFSTVLGTWGKDVAQFMPTVAGGSFIRTIREPTTLSPWAGPAVPALWVVAGVRSAAFEPRRRDV